jgi:hypothetical protein
MSADEEIRQDARTNSTGPAIAGKCFCRQEESSLRNFNHFQACLLNEVVQRFDCSVTHGQLGVDYAIDQ